MRRARALGIVLIVLVGLLNFHIPHFLFQSRGAAGYPRDVLELILLANVLGAFAEGPRASTRSENTLLKAAYDGHLRSSIRPPWRTSTRPVPS